MKLGILALWLAFTSSFAMATTFTAGETKKLSVNDSGNGNLLCAQSAQLAQAGVLQSLSFYVRSASGKLRMGVYDNSGPNGGPGKKVAETNEIVPVVGWNTANVVVQKSLPIGNYWLAYLPQKNALGFQNGYGGAEVHFAYTYGALPSVFSTAPSKGGTHWSFYATLNTSTSSTPAPSPDPAPTPTPTPAPAPAPTPTGSCSGAAQDVAGGADGTGTCWPGPSNTGVPAITVLTTYNGPCTITTAGTVIDSKLVNCDLSIQAANVMIKNSKVNGQVILDSDIAGSSQWSFTLQDSEVDAGKVQMAAVGWGNLHVVRSNIHGGVTAVQCEEKSVSCLIEDSYLHGQYIPDNQPWHLGGFLSDGGQNITIRHNFVVCDHAVNSVGGGCTGDINLIPNFAPINGALIEHNLLGANIGSAYCTYGGEKSGSTYPHSYNVVYRDNVFKRGSNGKCADYGPVTGFSSSNSGNQWINNVYEDGVIVPPEN
jgi:hypothetical protein